MYKDISNNLVRLHLEAKLIALFKLLNVKLINISKMNDFSLYYNINEIKI